MSDLKNYEKRTLEEMFDMEHGYVLPFEYNKPFERFVADSVSVELYTDNYTVYGTSKANRLRACWSIDENEIVGKLTHALINEYLRRFKLYPDEIKKIDNAIVAESKRIANRLLGNSSVVELESIIATQPGRDLELLIQNIKNSVLQNQHEAGLDRLHTYMVNYTRALCEKYEVPFTQAESLNAIFGKYVKHIEANDLLQSEMSKSILKTSISVLSGFNDVRNNTSLAHDNTLLNFEESVLIFNHIASLVRFLNQLEGVDGA